MSKAQRVIAFDYGEKRIGVAVGQSVTKTANPLKALSANNGQPNWELVSELFKEWQPDYLVVGLPLNMDDSEQTLTLRAKKFANRLNGRFQIKVELMDERLSSVEARDNLYSSGGYQKLSNSSIDSEAACLILESWFREYSS